MAKISRDLTCPKCGFAGLASLNVEKYKFLIFRCPWCAANVVVYAHKLNTISDSLMNTLLHSNKLRYCGNLRSTEGITEEKIQKLHDFLSKEQDFDRILSQL